MLTIRRPGSETSQTRAGSESSNSPRNSTDGADVNEMRNKKLVANSRTQDGNLEKARRNIQLLEQKLRDCDDLFALSSMNNFP